MKDNTPTLTPIEQVGDVYLKRDDTFCIAGIRGGKVRACWELATRTTANADGLFGPRKLLPADGLITASARRSPQAQIVARLAHRLGIPARCHMPTGEMTEEMHDVVAHGGTLVRHKPGYNSVIVARAKEDIRHKSRRFWRYIPFGMEHAQALVCTEKQVRSIPVTMAFGLMKKPKRIVVCVGSGMTAAGILWGLKKIKLDIPVVGVRVGADPKKRLNKFAPCKWWNMMEIVDATKKHKYHDAVEAKVGDVLLDPHYEAKCLEFVEPGDLFWLVGIRTITTTA